MIAPERKHISVATSGPNFDTCDWSIRARILVGPRLIPLTFPNMAYVKPPTNAEYKPYSGDKPAPRRIEGGQKSNRTCYLLFRHMLFLEAPLLNSL